MEAAIQPPAIRAHLAALRRLGLDRDPRYTDFLREAGPKRLRPHRLLVVPMRSKQVIALRRYGSSPGSAIRETTFDTLERLFLNDPDLAFSNAAIGMLALDVMGIAFLPRVEDYVEAP